MYNQMTMKEEHLWRENGILKGQLEMLQQEITDIAYAANIVSSAFNMLSGPECLLVSKDIQRLLMKNEQVLRNLIMAAQKQDVDITLVENAWTVTNLREPECVVNGDWLDSLIASPPTPSKELQEAIARYHAMKRYAVPLHGNPSDSVYELIMKDNKPETDACNW